LAKKLNILVFTDNKPGHKNQLLGLLKAMELKQNIHASWININTSGFSLLNMLKNLWASRNEIDLVIGAGHKTHTYLIMAKLICHSKIIVLMKPSLPICWFDWALIPTHDGHFSSPHVIPTQGAINTIQPSDQKNLQKGLFLIGGPSKHHRWNNTDMALQIKTICQAHVNIHWQLTTSRRTPQDFLHHLDPIPDNMTVTPHEQTNAHWLPDQLTHSEQVWISEDSVSMLYEALTAGSNVGVLKVKSVKKSRVQQGVNRLINNHNVTGFDIWQKNKKTLNSTLKLDEATRCADLILEQFNHAH